MTNAVVVMATALLMRGVVAGVANNGTEKKCVGLIKTIYQFQRFMRNIPIIKKLMTATTLKSPPPWALGLGYGGLIPFVALALSIWLFDRADRFRSVNALLAYSACILSFLGAIHWGLVMRDETFQSKKLLVWGVIPSLLAWIALLINPTVGLYLVAAGLWACFAVDRLVYSRVGVQMWVPMRLVLTVVASLSCIAGAIGITQ